MTSRYLHTMLRVTDPEKSRAFYEALGMEFRRESPIVRNGELEATLYFFGYPGQEEELELTFNHDGSTYELGTAYGHIAIGVDDLGLSEWCRTLDVVRAVSCDRVDAVARERGLFVLRSTKLRVERRPVRSEHDQRDGSEGLDGVGFGDGRSEVDPLA